MPMARFSVLVVSGGGFSGQTLIKGLQRSTQIRVIVADCYSENIGKYFADRYVVVPPLCERDAFVDCLYSICREEDVRLIFPSTDHELTILSEIKEDFYAKGIHISVSDPGILEKLRNKKIIDLFLQEAGLPSIPIVSPHDTGVVFPIIGKPIYGSGSRDHVILHTRSDLEKIDDDINGKYIFQPLLSDFTEYSADFAVGFDGTISGIAVRERVRTSLGFAVITDTAADETACVLAEKAARAIAEFGGRGIFNIQVIEHAGSYYISDVNPRIGTSAVFSYDAGINYPLFMCSSIEPEIIKNHLPGTAEKHKVPSRMVRYLEEKWFPMDAHRGVKGIVFDLDDTLMNQKKWIMDRMKILWETSRTRLPGMEEFILKALTVLEEGNRARLFDALDEHFSFGSELKNSLINGYRKIIPDESPLYPESLDVLQELRLRNYRTGLITDNPPVSQVQKIEACGLREFFEVIYLTREHGEEKPSAAAFRGIAEKMGIDPGELVMVGDNLYRDIKGALDAGYGAAFWLVRGGGFFNFDYSLFSESFSYSGKIFSIRNLAELLPVFSDDC